MTLPILAAQNESIPLRTWYWLILRLPGVLPMAFQAFRSSFHHFIVDLLHRHGQLLAYLFVRYPLLRSSSTPLSSFALSWLSELLQGRNNLFSKGGKLRFTATIWTLLSWGHRKIYIVLGKKSTKKMPLFWRSYTITLYLKPAAPKKKKSRSGVGARPGLHRVC